MARLHHIGGVGPARARVCPLRSAVRRLSIPWRDRSAARSLAALLAVYLLFLPSTVTCGAPQAGSAGGQLGRGADRGADRAPDESPGKGLPLQFESEVIRLFVETDTLRIEGEYRLLCSPSKAQFTMLFYPYPSDSLLGGAETVSLERRTPREPWAPLDFVEIPDSRGTRWKVPLTLGDTLDVRCVYRQALLASYGRYVVTTTRAWGRPLRHARFEIYLPQGATPVSFSHPFGRVTSDGRVFYLYEAADFLPRRDITFEWRPAAANED